MKIQRFALAAMVCITMATNSSEHTGSLYNFGRLSGTEKAIFGLVAGYFYFGWAVSSSQKSGENNVRIGEHSCMNTKNQ